MARYKKLFLFIFCTVIFVITISVAFKKNSNWNYYLALGWDAQGYYLYLPAVFINHGFEGLDVRYSLNSTDPDQITYVPYPGTKKIFIKYTYGVAFMESPFFLAARAYYKWRYPDNEEPNIYHSTYMKSIIIADAFYLFAGLLISGLFLLRYFSLGVVLLTESILWLGTSLLFYTSFCIGYSHVCSFFLISLIVYLTPVVYAQRKMIWIFLLALLVSIITLIRPTNIVILLYPLLYEIYSWHQLRDRISLLWRKWYHGIWFMALCVLAWVPQFYYWHYLSGHWLIYSYKGEGFKFWKNPQVLHVLFDPQNGFLLFAPLMMLSIAGLLLCIRRKVFSGWGILSVFLVTLYICASWWYWTFGAAYGYRPFIDFLPILAIPLAYFLAQAGEWRRPARATLIAGIIFFLFLSVRLQQVYSFPWQGPNWGWDDIIRVHKEALYIR